MPLVKITHHTNGTKTTEVEGIKGNGCLAVSKRFVGTDEVLTDEETPEMHEAQLETEENKETDG